MCAGAPRKPQREKSDGETGKEVKRVKDEKVCGPPWFVSWRFGLFFESFYETPTEPTTRFGLLFESF